MYSGNIGNTALIVAATIITMSASTTATAAAAAAAATTSAATTMTLGMQLDAAIARLDSLSSPQLYGLIVAVTVLVATLLLGTAQPLEDKIMTRTLHGNKTDGTTTGSSTATAATVKAAGNTTTTKTATTNGGSGPEPRWYIFRLFNYAVLLAFTASVVEFVLHAADKDRTQLVRVLVAWCMCLIYFFGFFGVSIVHDADVDPGDDGVVVVSAPKTGGGGTPVNQDSKKKHQEKTS